jgi:hypothetical protein
VADERVLDDIVKRDDAPGANQLAVALEVRRGAAKGVVAVDEEQIQRLLPNCLFHARDGSRVIRRGIDEHGALS